MADENDGDSNSPDAEEVATRGGQAAASAAEGASQGAPPEAIATDAATGTADVADAAGGDDVATAVRAGTASATAAQSVAQAAQSGDPGSAIGAAGSTVGAAGAVAGATGGSEAAQAVAQGASVVQQAASAAQSVAGLAESASSSSDGPAESALVEVVDVLSEAVSGGGVPLDEARFDFTLTNGPDIDWLVKRFSISSELSRLYEIHIDLICNREMVPIDEMLGAECELLVERGDLMHSFYGIIDEVDDLGPDQGRMHASVRVIPAFGLLADQVDTRIFQGQTVVEILTTVLGEALAVYNREFNASDFLKREYNPRDYCTQFRESTFDFCCRLMEEEGIAFHFVPDEDARREMLVLIDNNNDYPEVELGGDEEVPIIESNPEDADRESVRGVLWRQRRHINKVVGRAYNFKDAATFEVGEAVVTETHNHHDQELYVHDLRRQITDDPVEDAPGAKFDGKSLDQRAALVTQVLEEHRAQTKTAYGNGNVTGFRPGTRFKLEMYHRADVEDHGLLVVRANHSGSAATEGGGSTASYGNEFTAIPETHEFRPPQRHSRAKVYGPHLAKVVGAAGSDDEIHTDVHGRIKVQFHFDRLQPADNGASVWMRVMQPWAGPQWGTMFIPRVGMEVVVQFVDGNPDNPVVVGSLYNSQNKPPYTLPDEKTKSTIKTSSSVGGDGYNELTFEDAAGQEQIIVHAQKDFNKKVLNNQSRSVGANDSTSVGGNQSLSVSKDRTHSVEGSETLTITGSQKITITGAATSDGQTVTGGQMDITGKYKLDASEAIDVQAPDYIKMMVGDTFMLIEPDKITLQQKDGSRVVLSPDSALMASKENSQVTLTADAQMQANTGGDVTLTANAQMTGLDAQVLLDGSALVKSADGAEVLLNADASMSGANATMDGKTASTVSAGSTATLTAGGSTVKTAAAAVDVSGPQANIAGSGAVNITGGIIKLN
ncbi:MAG: type VI secretion system tip protein VgrG [Nannocystaceae bacterium]|nr:type VI secretion system tip protein VgrG [Nannocystaceae bacterium]